MAAQQIKSYIERLIEQNDWSLNHTSKERISEQTTTMQNQSSSVSSSEQTIRVADFARFKVEELSNDTTEFETLEKKIKIENSPEKADDCTVLSEDNSVVLVQDSSDEFDSIPPFSIESKEELLAPYAECSTIKVLQNDPVTALNCEAHVEEVKFPIKSNVTEDSQTSQNCIVIDEEENKSNDLLLKTEKVDIEVTSLGTNRTKLVKNPLAFLKKSYKHNADQLTRLNRTIKAEATVAGNDLESTIKVEPELNSINLNGLVIKSEEHFVAETHEETIEESILYQTCLSYNLDSSLDVNLSDEEKDLNDLSAKPLPENVISNISLTAKPEPLKYFSTFEISSGTDDEIIFQKPNLNEVKKPRKKQTATTRNLKEHKLRRKRNNQLRNRQQVKKLIKKVKTKKRTKKDTAYKFGSSKRNALKNIPKKSIKTRKTNTTKTLTKEAAHFSKAEFPKPFKLETEEKVQNRHVELPKPMTFKREIAAKRWHLKPEFQPLVRLKRLKSEELLVPMRTKHNKRTRQFKSSMDETRRDFLIQQAFSLNPSIKCNRLSLDNDPTYRNEQHSLNRRYANSCSILSDIQNESSGAMESKYFSTQETFFQSSTPDGDGVSTFSGPIDSGVSTSTPSTSHHNYNTNTLLLEIAAERAFINNHLMHFGHSPIQFDLYNNLNELTIFLKFLLGPGL